MPDSRSFGLVDEKLLECEYFLTRLIESADHPFEVRYLFSAFVSACRSVTFSMQAVMKSIIGFKEWYATWQKKMTADPLSRFFVQARNLTQKVGAHPIKFGVIIDGAPRHYFYPDSDFDSVPSEDVVTCCRHHFRTLVELVHDCYIVFGEQIDPQRYFTREAFLSRGLTIDDADFEVMGIRGWTGGEGAVEEDMRWIMLRRTVGETAVSALFTRFFGQR